LFCPNCQAEYRPGFTRCADCNVDLVESLDQAPAKEQSEGGNFPMPVLLWSGVDRATLEQLRETLDNVDIAYNDETLEARLLYASMRNPLELWVKRQDLEAAKQAVASLFAPGEEDLENVAVGAAAQGDKALATAPSDPNDPDDDFDGAYATDSSQGDVEEEEENPFEDPPLAQVWSGKQPDMARILKDCLREHGLRSEVIHEEAGKLGLWVREKNENRAKQIVREVVEAAPPEDPDRPEESE
jgi:hypothetical protein